MTLLIRGQDGKPFKYAYSFAHPVPDLRVDGSDRWRLDTPDSPMGQAYGVTKPILVHGSYGTYLSNWRICPEDLELKLRAMSKQMDDLARERDQLILDNWWRMDVLNLDLYQELRQAVRVGDE